MKNVKLDVDCIIGNINVESPKLLCLTIHNEKGWSAAYVDGKEYMHSGILLDAGGHDIELIYHTLERQKNIKKGLKKTRGII